MICEEIIEKYLETLKDEFKCVKENGLIRIITPYLYPDNDLIEVFVREIAPDRIMVTDLGETFRHLHSQGVDVFSTIKRKYLIETISSNTNTKIIQGKLIKETTLDKVGETIFDIIETSKAIGDLIYTSVAYEPAVFIYEVESYLKENNIKYLKKIIMDGVITGKKYSIDFKILNSSDSLLQTLSAKTAAGISPKVNATFRMWYDIDKQVKKLSVLNDIDFKWKGSDIILLKTVSKVVFWSEKEKILEIQE